MLFSVLILFLTLMLLIGFHELGHFLAAKWLHVNVQRLSIGFGKVLWRKDIRGTEYVFCLFPVGGYVQLLDSRQTPENASLLAFDKQPAYKRAIILIAGAFFNLILAFAAYWFVFLVGITQPLPVIGAVLPHSPAASAGIPINSQIIAVANKPVATWGAVVFALLPYAGESGKIPVTVKSSQTGVRTYTLSFKSWQLDKLRPNLLQSAGIQPWRPEASTSWPQTSLGTRKLPALQAFLAAGQEVWLYLQINTIILKKLLAGDLSLKALAGPLGLFAGTLHAANQGMIMFIAFLGFISISLAFTNLLPIPGLDGSQLVYLFIEKMPGGKPVSGALQLLLFRLGVIIIAVLLVQTLTNDMLRLI